MHAFPQLYPCWQFDGSTLSPSIGTSHASPALTASHSAAHYDLSRWHPPQGLATRASCTGVAMIDLPFYVFRSFKAGPTKNVSSPAVRGSCVCACGPI